MEQREQPRVPVQMTDHLDLDEGVGGKVLGGGQTLRACPRGLTAGTEAKKVRGDLARL